MASTLQWILILVFGVAFLLVAPLSKTAAQFFDARGKDNRAPKFWTLVSSLVISWIFAKSITNAANLGHDFGLLGGVAYAVYYLSFVVAGLVIFKMRTQGGFKSIHQFLQSKFGRTAVVLFSILIAFRLFNEVWSNTMVIGSYFGKAGSANYYWAILVFTLLTLAYTMKGGLRSSLLTDAIQMLLFGVLLALILSLILPKSSHSAADYLASSSTLSVGTTLSGGINLLLLALIQVFSYPFHDSVMTDRGFIADAKTTRKAFLWAAAIGFVCLVAFSFVGIHAQLNGLGKPAAVRVSERLGSVGSLVGLAGMLSINFIMITSAASTLDSTFSSFSKLVVIDLGKKKHHSVSRGRWMMVAITVVGTLPIFANPEILSATTVSGTMVMGLAPVFLFWRRKAPPLAYFLSTGFGMLVGIALATDLIPAQLIWFEGKYGDTLSCNLWGSAICFGLYLGAPYITKRKELQAA